MLKQKILPIFFSPRCSGQHECMGDQNIHNFTTYWFNFHVNNTSYWPISSGFWGPINPENSKVFVFHIVIFLWKWTFLYEITIHFQSYMISFFGAGKLINN